MTKNMKNNANHEKNGPESLKLLRVPTTPPTTPTTPSTPSSRGLEDVFKDLPITDETSCGIWCLRGPTLQRFANKKAYVFLYGVLGCIFSASYAYFNGTITTIEKRFKIPSKTTGSIPLSFCLPMVALIFNVEIVNIDGAGIDKRWLLQMLVFKVCFVSLT